MRIYFGFLILLGAALVLSGCVERHYAPYYYGGGGYYGGYGYYDRDHGRWHDDDGYRFRHGRDDRH